MDEPQLNLFYTFSFQHSRLSILNSHINKVNTKYDKPISDFIGDVSNLAWQFSLRVSHFRHFFFFLITLDGILNRKKPRVLVKSESVSSRWRGSPRDQLITSPRWRKKVISFWKRAIKTTTRTPGATKLIYTINLWPLALGFREWRTIVRCFCCFWTHK